MEHQKNIKFLRQCTKLTIKFGTKNWAERNEESTETYNTNSQIKFKTKMLKSSLCDYSDAYILVTTVNNTATDGAAATNTKKNVIFKNCTIFTNFISEINNTQVDNAKDIDIVMQMYNLIEYRDNYSKTYCSSKLITIL